MRNAIPPKTRHQIYSRFIFLMENRKFRSVKTGKQLPCILHERTKQALISEYNYTRADIAAIEDGIISDAEHLSNWEILQDVPLALFHDLKMRGETNLIFVERIFGIPSFLLNELICIELQKDFSTADLLAVDGFILTEGCIRLDLDEKYSKRGFIIPIYQDDLIFALKVFRYPNDNKPFFLRSRRRGDYAQ